MPAQVVHSPADQGQAPTGPAVVRSAGQVTPRPSPASPSAHHAEPRFGRRPRHQVCHVHREGAPPCRSSCRDAIRSAGLGRTLAVGAGREKVDVGHKTDVGWANGEWCWPTRASHHELPPTGATGCRGSSPTVFSVSMRPRFSTRSGRWTICQIARLQRGFSSGDDPEVCVRLVPTGSPCSLPRWCCHSARARGVSPRGP